LRLVAPSFFHNLSILFPLCSGFLVRRSYEVGAEISEPSVDLLFTIRRPGERRAESDV
jgi:hypothetical protein